MEWVQFLQIVAIPAVLAAGGWLLSALAACRRESAALAKRFDDFRVEVARDYVNARTLAVVEQRIGDELRDINRKLDRMAERAAAGD